jgi:glutaredoxin
VAIAAAAGLRIHAALEDRAAAAVARRDSATITAPPLEGTTATSGKTPVAATVETATPSPAEKRIDPNEARRERERLVAEAERSVQIDLYGEGWCPSCRKARAWLDANSVPYTYRDTSDAVNKHTMRALNPNSTIPTIDVDGQVLVGFSATALRASIRRAAEARVAKGAGAASR